MPDKYERRVTIPMVQAMKGSGIKSVCLVAWDYHMALISDRVEADIISVGDSVGVNLWGHRSPLEVTMDEILVVCKAARRGTQHALLSCDLPFGPVQAGPAAAVHAAIRLAKEAGIDMVKLDGAAEHPDAVEAVAKAGIPVFAQFGITPQTALRYGVDYGDAAKPGAEVPDAMADEMIIAARRLESAGASLLNFTNSGPSVGPRVVEAVSIPVLGGFGGGPWLDGRIRMTTAALGYSAAAVDEPPPTYANVGRLAFDALTQVVIDVREGRHLRGQHQQSSL